MSRLAVAIALGLLLPTPAWAADRTDGYLRLAYAHLDRASDLILWVSPSGATEPGPFDGAARSQLALATEQLIMARLSTKEPERRQAIDRLIAGMDRLRQALSTDAYRARRLSADLESELLSLSP